MNEHKASRTMNIDNPEEFIRFDKGIDVAEDQIADGVRESLRNRWEFGKLMLAKRKGKQLPNGMLDELAEITGRSRAELGFRMQFAERYPTEDEVSRALETFTSWTQVKRKLPKPPPPQPKPTPVPTPQPQPEKPTPEKQRDETAETEALIDWSTVTGTAKVKAERMARAISREMRAEYEALVEAEVQKRVEHEKKVVEHERALRDEERQRYRQVLDARKGIMTKADYALIRRCLHPDTRDGGGVSVEELNRAFDVFNRLQLLFLNEKDFPTAPVPSSFEDLKRRRAARKR